MHRQLGLGLEAKERIMQLLIIDVNLAHLRLHTFTRLLLRLLLLFLFRCGTTQLVDTGVRNEIWGCGDKKTSAI